MGIQFTQQNLLQNATEYATRSHRVISQNMANVNTPEYQTREISFERFVEQMSSKNESNRSPVQLEVETLDHLPTRMDGNNVDLDNELAKLKQNELFHQTLIQLLGSKADTMRAAMRR